MKNTLLINAIAVTATTLSLNTLAYESGDWIVRGGGATIEPNESSSPVRIGGGDIDDTRLGVSNDTQFGLTITYMLSDQIGIELLASSPFEHDVILQGEGLAPTVTGGTTIAAVEHLPPTLSLQYFFLDKNSAWQPYVGMGLNYWLVLDEELSSAATSVLGASRLEVDNSLGLSLQVGVDYMLNDNWLLNAAAWRVDIDTEASFESSLVNDEVSADIAIDPWVFMLSVGYRF